MTIEWEEPRQPTRRTIITRQEAARVVDIVQSRMLDAERVQLEGILRTKSDVSALHIETEPDHWIPVARGDLTADAQHGIELGERVCIIADMVVKREAGGGETLRYTARSIERLDEA